MIDISIICAGIRPERWVKLYETAVQSCTRYSFELLFVGPYPLPLELQNNPQIRYIQDWGTSCRCAQIATLSCSGKLIVRADDDGDYYPDSLNQCIDLYYSFNNPKHAIGLRYREGKNFKGKRMQEMVWLAKTNVPGIQNVPDHYVNSPNVLMLREYLIELGGWDCRFEHLAFAAYDLAMRIQRDGAMSISSMEIMNNNWEPKSKIHKPIELSHTAHDMPLFYAIQSDPKVLDRIKIDIDNWKLSSKVWARRFGSDIQGVAHPELGETS